MFITNKSRISLDEYFMRVVDLVKQRSTCRRASYGAVIVKDKMIISTGYNGAARGISHCDKENDCITDEEAISQGKRAKACRASHAEANAIVQAARIGVSLLGTIMYTDGRPCNYCMKLILNSGIKEIVVKNCNYKDPLADKLLELSDVKLRILEVY